jgi:hypothetical protein
VFATSFDYAASCLARTVPDPRARALACYLRQRAAEFSLSADFNDAQATARAGMALLDAADLAELMHGSDPRLRSLSEALRFESMPNHEARFLETQPIRAAMQRPLTVPDMTGRQVLDLLITTALTP